jgi:hypothetical protein
MSEAIEGEITLSKEEQKNALRKYRQKKKLPVLEKKWLSEYLKNGGNATQAALIATNCTTYDTAKSRGAQLKKALEPEINAALTKWGLTEEKIVTTHVELLDSKKDAVRMKAVEQGYKLIYKDGEKDSNVTINLNF